MARYRQFASFGDLDLQAGTTEIASDAWIRLDYLENPALIPVFDLDGNPVLDSRGNQVYEVDERQPRLLQIENFGGKFDYLGGLDFGVGDVGVARATGELRTHTLWQAPAGVVFIIDGLKVSMEKAWKHIYVTYDTDALLDMYFRGADQFFGFDGNDDLFARAGNDVMKGRGGDDTLDGGTGADTVMGGDGADRLYGGKGADMLDGDAGADRLRGEAGADALDGGKGHDSLLGGGGDDDLRGGGGRDRLVGGAGDDALDGGAGADVFVMSDRSGDDVAAGWRNGIDMIEITRGAAAFDELEISDGARGAVIVNGDASMTLRGVDAADLDASDFIFT